MELNLGDSVFDTRYGETGTVVKITRSNIFVSYSNKDFGDKGLVKYWPNGTLNCGKRVLRYGDDSLHLESREEFEFILPKVKQLLALLRSW